MRSLAVRLGYATGGLAAYHRAWNAPTLTVAMFHRILPAGHVQAHRGWALTRDVFEGCLDFFARHYHVVSLADVQSGLPLPARALLVTFDDGWGDNEAYALEPLRRRRMPAVVFAVAGAIGGDECWQEPLLRAWDEGRITEEACAGAWRKALGETAPGNGIHGFVIRLSGRPEREKQAVFEHLAPHVAPPEPGAMLTGRQLKALSAAGIAIQSHGMKHLPLGLLEDAAGELRESREAIATILRRNGISQELTSLSFPHGSYTPDVIRQARNAGYRLLFSSDPVLNRCAGGRPESFVLGRIPILAAEIADASGKLNEAKLARWLFLRPRTALEAAG
jgi:peptidoglycan/xylan/chitin deacetylase (PgdA/CDA1 family)